jgi:mono/diheme cytochrome c family protein
MRIEQRLFLASAITLLGVLLLRQEAFAEILEILSWQCDEEKRYIIARGEVKNTSSEPLSLTAVVTYRNSAGNLVKHDRATIEFNPLRSGQSSPFEVASPSSPEIVTCELAFREGLKGITIQGSGKLELATDLPPVGDARTGKILFNGKGVCFGCHGREGDLAQVSSKLEISKLNPKPTDLRNSNVLRFKTDRERFRVIKHGIPGTAMVAMTHVTEEEIMSIIAYLDELKMQARSE